MTQPLSLEEFRRDPESVRTRLHESGEPQVLTVDGAPDLVIQDAARYEAMRDELESARFVAAVREGFASLDRGEGILLEDLEAEFAAEDAEAERAAQDLGDRAV